MRSAPLLVAPLLLSMLLAGCTGGGNGGNGNGTTTGSNGNPDWDTGGCNDFVEAAKAFPQPLVTFETTLGTIVAEICLEQVPLTAQNFLDLVGRGAYDGTTFHRVITDFMMQGGDLSTKPGNTITARNIQDEFHRLLRHEGKGVLSMANAGPHTGSSQFFITFADTDWLDDHHSVFGKVVQGLDVLDKANAEVASSGGAPKKPLTLTRATVTLPAQAAKDTAAMPPAVELWTPDDEQGVPETGGEAQFLVVVESKTNQRITVDVTGASGAAGVPVTIEPGFATVALPAYQRVALVVTANLTGAAASPATVTVRAASGTGSDELELAAERKSGVGPQTVRSGQQVSANYIGLTVDGRVFDTSILALAKDKAVPKYKGFTLRPDAQYRPFQFTPGSGVIQGFTELAVDTPVGGSAVGRMPPEKAYGTRPCPRDNPDCLSGRTLLFQLDVLSVSG